MILFGRLRRLYCHCTWMALPLVLVFAAGTLISALNTGTLSRYALLNKDAGLILLLLSYAAITSAVSEWDDVRRILRVFTVGVVAQN